MVDYAKLAATSLRLIEANSRSVTLFKTNRTPADSAKPWRGPDLSADPDDAEGGDTLAVLAAFVGARGSGFGRDARERENTVVKDGTQFALVANSSLPDGTNLREFNALRDGDDLWRIVFVGELKPATTSLVWELELTK